MPKGKAPPEADEVEYRLVCSGILHRDLGSDWTKCDAGRLLLGEPFTIVIAHFPLDHYPQELAVRFSVRGVTETNGMCSYSFLPDLEIVSDLAALLTLLCRRLITVGPKVSQATNSWPVPSWLKSVPFPVTTGRPAFYWQECPPTFFYGMEGVRVQGNQPPPKIISLEDISDLLNALPMLEGGEEIITCARHYAFALEWVESQYEKAYLSLISAVETMAGQP